MMSLLVPGLLATSVLFASGIRQLNAFKQGEIRDATSQLLGVLGCILAVFLVIQGLSDNGGRPTTGLMGTLLGALLLIIVLGSSIKHPVNALLIGVAPLTGLFTLVTSVAGFAIRSGCRAAKVFGVTSAKIRMTRVRTPVAMATPASPNTRTASTVAMAEARILTKLLPIRISPISRSGRSNSERIRAAAFEPSSAWC